MRQARLFVVLTMTIVLAACGDNDRRSDGDHRGHDMPNSGTSK